MKYKPILVLSKSNREFWFPVVAVVFYILLMSDYTLENWEKISNYHPWVLSICILTYPLGAIGEFYMVRALIRYLDRKYSVSQSKITD